MSDLKRDLPKDAFKMEETSRIHIENEVMRKIDLVEHKQVKPLGVRPQLMGFILICFFFLIGLIGVLSDVNMNFESYTFNGISLHDVFGKIPVEMHYSILVLSGGFLVYLLFQSLRDLAQAEVNSSNS